MPVQRFDPQRAVEITSPHYGSGYRIGGRLVLTARHLFPGSGDNTCKVRARDDFGEVKAQVVWKAPGADVALVQLSKKVPEWDPVGFGQLPAAGQSTAIIPFELYGWPQWAWTTRPGEEAKAGGRHICGTIYLADTSPEGLLVLEPERVPELPGPQAYGSKWIGISGAAVVYNGLVVAVQHHHQNPQRARSLEAELLSKVYDDPNWRGLLAQHGIPGDPVAVLDGNGDIETGYIFLSYARVDGRKYVENLEASLLREGFNVCFDKRSIRPTDDVTAEIEIGIQNSSLVALCITAESKSRDNFVQREYQYALSLDKPIIILRFSDIVPDASIANFEWIDFFRDWSEGFHKFCNMARKILSTSNRLNVIHAKNNDHCSEYLINLYKVIVKYLDQTVFSLITLYSADVPGAVHDSREVLPLSFTVFWDMATRIKEVAEVKSTLRKTFDSFESAFMKYKGRILLLGAPGSGKTTTLMAFTRDAVVRRLEDPSKPLPIIAPIVTWGAEKNSSINEWLAGDNPKLAGIITDHITNGRALLVLDGLDELGDTRTTTDKETWKEIYYDPRSRFIDKIPPNNQIIISSRELDYQSIGKKLSLNGAVNLQECTDTQIQTYLHKMPGLWEILQKDKSLLDVLRNPMLLSLFSFSFSQVSNELKQLCNLNSGTIRDQIFDSYLKRRYEHETCRPYSEVQFTLERIKHILSLVASKDIYKESKNILTFDYFKKALQNEEDVEGFIELATRLNILSNKGEEIYASLSFIHLMFRDYFAYPILVGDLCSRRGERRFNAVKALASLSDTRVSKNIIDMLTDEDDAQVRRMAIYSLGNLRDPQAFEFIVRYLKDRSIDVRLESIEQLPKFQDPRAIKSLLEMLGEEDFTFDYWGKENRVSKFAIEAIIDLSTLDKSLFDRIKLFINENDNDIAVSNAVLILGRLGDPRACEIVVSLLSHNNPKVRGFSAGAVGVLGCENAVKLLKDLLEDNEVAEEYRSQEPVGDPYASGHYYVTKRYVSEYAAGAIRNIEKRKKEDKTKKTD